MYLFKRCFTIVKSYNNQERCVSVVYPNFLLRRMTPNSLKEGIHLLNTKEVEWQCFGACKVSCLVYWCIEDSIPSHLCLSGGGKCSTLEGRWSVRHTDWVLASPDLR